MRCARWPSLILFPVDLQACGSWGGENKSGQAAFSAENLRARKTCEDADSATPPFAHKSLRPPPINQWHELLVPSPRVPSPIPRSQVDARLPGRAR